MNQNTDPIGLKEKSASASQLIVVMLLEDQEENSPTICLCAALGASRSIMSANSGLKLFSLNNEHCIPGNQNEEERIIEQLTKKSGLRNLEQGSQEANQAKSDLTEYICQLKMPQTRILGSTELLAT